jgi:hypothetical protein
MGMHYASAGGKLKEHLGIILDQASEAIKKTFNMKTLSILMTGNMLMMSSRNV